MSLQFNEVPDIWKHSRITPIHKGGDITDPQNYRPISIICVIAKVFEKLIYNQVSKYVENYNILSQFQSGFRPNYSTTSALLKLTNDVYSALDCGDLTGAIFIDLKKAFDLVDHYLLLDKLYAVGFSQNSLLWFNSYLHNRKQCVVIQGKQSDLFIQERGIPQGSILGPLLCSIFIKDLPLAFSYCSVHLYADDTVIYISNPYLTQIQNLLQSDFNALQEWLHSNNLLLNAKSHTMVFDTKRMFKQKSNDIKIMCNDGTYLHRVDQIKYLGLWLDPELSFKPHIDYILRKINFGTSVLYRSKNCFSYNVRKKLALQLILPFFDYADVIYQNTTKTNLLPLTIAYNKLCRFVIGCSYDTHHCIL
ncbi:putative RNA-directed DNA polymerase from transposon BS [Labeo rohita]|uniref:RNA-directed DNA polymerase from transposon BS n=1 Tax=Labeo rohita TaxID=84645 RepID=A0ABQ8MX32_LABRO|nr:putative RNA-directed DNA polymerase from transposon BS [Labeo rohita]